MGSPLVAIVMGSKSDWETMSHASLTLDKLQIEHEARVLSAHRTPAQAAEYFAGAEARGIQVIIAAAGMAAHLAGAAAAQSVLPVLGVPMAGGSLNGLDALLATVQMPAGIPVGTLAIGKAGAINASLLAAAILGIKHPHIREQVRAYRAAQTQSVLEQADDLRKS